MAKNTGNGFRKGAVTKRSQFQAPNGNFVKEILRMDVLWIKKRREVHSKALVKRASL
ncbi:hypothetical protein JI735_33135 [Paenibacillus sonchi]|uniref:Uncharacterized protein n=1 Tax=Paenibacillus sonchi TaxID=373687 RepID=A0A974PIA9_9BACL|nr:hypothetical protein [Paenibacillus sonchi]QQZ64457.1 hypothetical protein JI735_33135 [Paenibacillus sonchi]